MFSHSTNTASFFSVLIAALIFSLSLAGVAAAQEQHQSGDRCASEQHHGQLQHRHRIRRAL